jgi:ribosome-interacting GTPase 1
VKAGKEKENVPIQLYTTAQLVVITGMPNEEDTKMVLLRYPAVVTSNSAGTGYTFTALPLVDNKDCFVLYKTVLLGSAPMPAIMHKDFVAYVKRRTDEK